MIPMSKLFVANIPFSAVDQNLAELFEPFGGAASVRIIRDKDSGRSLGFAFVELREPSSVDAALAGINGREWMGRILRAAVMRPSDDEPRIR